MSVLFSAVLPGDTESLACSRCSIIICRMHQVAELGFVHRKTTPPYPGPVPDSSPGLPQWPCMLPSQPWLPWPPPSLGWGALWWRIFLKHLEVKGRGGLPCLCSMPRTHQIQSCQAERFGQRGQSEPSPWCLAPGPPARLWVRNFLLQGSRWRSAGVSARNQHAAPTNPSPPLLPKVPLHPTCGLIVVYVDPLQLQVTVPVICARGVDAMLITDHLPELKG